MSLDCVVAKVEIPERGSVTFVSTIGQLDGRIDLYKGLHFIEHLECIDSVTSGRVGLEPASRGLIDLCVMASKLVYEKVKVVENVIDLWNLLSLIGYEFRFLGIHSLLGLLYWGTGVNDSKDQDGYYTQPGSTTEVATNVVLGLGATLDPTGNLCVPEDVFETSKEANETGTTHPTSNGFPSSSPSLPVAVEGQPKSKHHMMKLRLLSL